MLCSRSGFLYLSGYYAHTLFNTFFIPNSDFSNGSDAFFYKLGINFTHVLLQLFKDHFIIFIVDDSRQNLDLFVFDVIRVCEFGEKTLNVVLED